MKSIAILGGGYTGLAAAKKLCSEYKVTIFEKQNSPGGMAGTFDFHGKSLEYLYHHIFRSDSYVTDLARELSLIDDFVWPLTQMGYFTEDKMHPFGTPVALLKFSPLPFFDKFKFGLSILKIKSISDYQKLENITATEWLKKNAGQKAYKTIWEPLLKSKFGSLAESISMSWLWGKIVLRGSSGSSGGETLGYMKNSFSTLTNAFVDFLEKSDNFSLKTNFEVASIEKNNHQYVIKGKSGEQYDHFDIVISTLAYPLFTNLASSILTTSENNQLSTIKYTASRCLVFSLNQSFMPFYWLNIGESDIPFGGLIEHTKMISKENYGGKHILYISNYMYSDDALYSCSKEDLINEYSKHLKRINPQFNENWIETSYDFKEEYAQPVIDKGYSQKIPPMSLSEPGLYIASMPQIYPEDRGLNYAIRLGYQIAAKVGADFEQ